MVSLQTWDSFPVVEHGRLTEPFHLAPIQECLQNVLLYIQIVVDHLLESLPQFRQVLHGLLSAKIPDIVAGGLRAEGLVIADVLLDTAAFVMAANHGTAEMQILDGGL
jgi:hypothetical protein